MALEPVEKVFQKVLNRFPVVGLEHKEPESQDDSITPATYLHSFMSANLERLTKQEMHALRIFLEQEYKLDLGTMCSGTEAPVLVVHSLAQALLKYGIVFKWDHRFSCEWNAAKREFARIMVPGFDIQVNDARELAEDDEVLQS